MSPTTTLQGEHWRIGLITESLIRLEWSDSGEFEDRATLMAVDRAFLPSGAVDYTTGERDGMLVVETPALRLTYDRKPFSKEGLTIVVKGVPDSQFNTWHYGDDPKGNLGGTARTLDEADGAIPLGQGVISRDGWAVLDDSASNVFVTADADGNLPDGVVAYGGIGVAPRDHRETDIYFFGYGRRYREAVHDFQKLSGPAPLLPRFALGNWWSRYYRYSQDEYLDLMDRFKSEGIPFTTSVIDMDWHLVDDVDPRFGSGWTGYTWNRKLFPDHRAFLEGLHDRGLKTTLNVHPRDGIRAFEEPYAKAAATVGVDAEAQEPVEFDLTNPRFVRAYFDMHHDLETEGVDFWWLDWQQGGVTRQPGLDPLWVLNHLHYLDSGRDGRWPLTFSRFAGPGSQRYPVGFSGDTVVTWKSLKFQPYFTATASNIGYGWWSHDIGGHMFGYRDEELEARWYQLGVFSPINRLHSTCSPFSGKEPWNFHEPVRSAMVDVLRLRQALMPYLYTMNWRAAVDGDPIVEPMYWANPNLGESYEVPDEFRFGTELVVAPVVDPMDKASMRGKADAWLPQGDWFDFFDGRRYVAADPAGRRLAVWRTIDRIPVFAKAGGIVPMQSDPLSDMTVNPRALDVVIFPGADGSFAMREDSGEFREVCADAAAAQESATAVTAMTWQWDDGRSPQFVIEASTGNTSVVPERRDWTLIFRGVARSAMQVIVGGEAWDKDLVGTTVVDYDAETLSLSVKLYDVPSSSRIQVLFPQGLALAESPTEADCERILFDAQMLYTTKEHAMAQISRYGVAAIPGLRTLEREQRNERDFFQSHMPESVIGALEEVLLRG
ncbi:alpha-glucosidase [Bifidobacterium pullorum subsp. saeculare]|uniref:glycoside hydrolase family 31 protein n=1 Tax=Bifidobacterium pullorum TaxID=78448 RepID=UPI00195D907E|nr:glycoside hydrolase family 31 protein [Bifidobacterium pullorum]MBM6692149.1 alpha-glucosidase [Bifidobacterium pullorum subsp. saeculare]